MLDNVINGDDFGAGGGGKDGGSSGGTGGQEDPNTLRSKAIANLLYLIGEGEVKGFADPDPLKSIIVNKVPVKNASGTQNFQGLRFWARAGTATQQAIPGFDQVTSEFQVGQRCRYGIPVIYSTQSDQLDAVIATINIPALTKLDTETGDLKGYNFSIAFDVRSLGDAGNDWVQVATDYESGKCTSPYEKSYRIPLHGTTGPWLVRMRRLTPDSDDDSKIADETYFGHVTEVSEYKVAYADSAVCGVEIDSELLGQQADIQFDILGRIINVPTNYNPVTRTYTGFWNGTFKLAWSDDPAWVLMDVCMNPRYGLQMPASAIDKWGLLQLSQYCNDMVPDGFGGTQHRFTFNGTFYTQEDAYKTVQAICSMMRAVSFYAAGALMVRQDRPVPPQERVYTPANIIGEFSYASTARTARHNACVVEWRNPDLGYDLDYEVYEDREQIIKFGFNSLTIRAIGTTNRGQAYRQAKWAVLTDQLNTDTISFTAGLDSESVLPGDTIEVADPHWATADFGGRLEQDGTIDAHHVKLDRPIDFAGSVSPQLHLTLLTGPMDDVANVDNTNRLIQRELRYFSTAVTAFNPATNVATLADPIPDGGDDGLTPLVWIFSKSTINPRAYKVINIEENTDDHTFTITGLQYDPEKYVRMDENFHIDYDPGDNYSNLPPTAYCPPVTNVKLEATRVGETWQMHVSWTPPNFAYLVGFAVRYKRDDDNWIDLPITKSTYIDFPAIVGSYIVGVKAINHFGIRSSEVFAGLGVGEHTANNSTLSITDLFTDRGDQTFIDRDIHLFWLSNSTVMRTQTAAIIANVIKSGSASSTDGTVITVDGSTPSVTDAHVNVDISDPYSPTIIPTGTFDLGESLVVHIGMSMFTFQAPANGTTANAMAIGLGNLIEIDPRFSAFVSSNVITITFNDTETNASTLEAHDDPMFFRYIVGVYDVATDALIREDYSLHPEYLYSYANNIQDFGLPRRAVKFAVCVQDVQGNRSPDTFITAYNQPPELPTLATAVRSGIFTARYTPPIDPDFAGLIIWMSDLEGFEPDVTNRVWHDRGNPALPLVAGGTFYYRYAGFDRFGDTDLIISDEVKIDLTDVNESGGNGFVEVFIRWPTEPPIPLEALGIWSKPSLFDSRAQTWRFQTTDITGIGFAATDSIAVNPQLDQDETLFGIPDGWVSFIPDWTNHDFGPVWRTTSFTGGAIIPGNGGGSPGTVGGPAAVFISSWSAFASFAPVQVGGPVIVGLGPSGTLTCSSSLSFTQIGNESGIYIKPYCYAKWQYRVAGSGGGWTDIATEIYASTPANNNGVVGHINFSMTKAGLLKNTDYEVRALARKSTGDRPLIFSGTATIQGS